MFIHCGHFPLENACSDSTSCLVDSSHMHKSKSGESIPFEWSRHVRAKQVNIGFTVYKTASTNGCSQRAARPADLRLKYNPVMGEQAPKAPRRSSPHCDSVTTIGGGELMVLRWRQRRGRCTARFHTSGLPKVTWYQ